MRTFKTNLLGMALAGLILSACSQTGMYETADLMNEQAEASKSGFRLDPFGVGNENAKTYSSNSWETGCVPGNGTFAAGDFYDRVFTPVTVLWGGPNNNANSKTGNLTVYNTATKFVFRVSSTVAISDLIINGNSTGVGTPANTVLSYEVDLPAGWNAGDDYTFTVAYAGSGPQIQFPQTTYDLVGICTTTALSTGTTEPICEGTAFSLTATVTTSAETLTGGIIQILDSDNEVVASEAVTSTVRSVTYNVPTGTAGNYTYSAQYVRSTPSFRYQGSVSATTSTVNVIECGGCDIKGNEFSGEAVSCGTAREANFVFGSEDGVSYFKIQGGLTNFTGADAVVTVTGGTTTTEQRTPGGSSNRVITVEGSVGACETVIVNVKWNSANSGGIITGEWSVKDANGVELAPEVAGLSCPN